MPLSCPQSSWFVHRELHLDRLTTALCSPILAPFLPSDRQPFLCKNGLVHRNDQPFRSTQSTLYHLAIVNLPSYFPSLALLELASKHILHTLAARRALPSHTISPSHFRKNSRFQTSAPVLLKHSLSFSLQLFRDFIPYTQTLTFGVIAASGSRYCRSNPKLGPHQAAF